ncbi:MAG: glycosyltransferase, partial [Deltaproteobacteria bacterium]|nr:glycosyltransferase [Deltaproteobacteria bacterium]
MLLPIAERDKKISDAKKRFFDAVADDLMNPGRFKQYYNSRTQKLIRFNIPRGASVLEIGCGTGDLLASLEPKRGLGIDFSKKIVAAARERHPDLEFQVADAQSFKTKEKFDYVLLSNLVGELVDVQRVLERLENVSYDRTRIVITHYNYLWGPFVKMAEKLGIKPRQREQNWLEIGDLSNLLELTGIETIKRGRSLLAPIEIPLVSNIVNEYLSPLPGLNRLCVNELVVGRALRKNRKRACKVSVIVACKDERGNIEEIFRTVPKMGKGTELIFVDGNSEDGTVEEINRCIEALGELNPNLDDARVYVQSGKGKGDAVRLGFEEASGEILMILDADITVRPEDLPKFHDALVDGMGEFINGTRLVYPMEDQAMRFLNMLGNHFFGWAFSWLLDQRLTDTLCGTKVLYKSDYEAIKRGRTYFGDFDPFG